MQPTTPKQLKAQPSLYCAQASPASKSSRRGFSLIEVVLSLGIVSFAFVGLFGLLPVGLNAFTNSVDSTVESQIAENVLTNVKQAKFSNLLTLADQNAGSNPALPPVQGYYFDDQGKAVAANPTSTTPANYVYSAGVQVYYDSSIPAGVQPSATSISIQSSTSSQATATQSQASAPMATVTVTIRKVSNASATRVYTSYVANNGL
jgi:uncharacterized protein (TIGR02598 family)